MQFKALLTTDHAMAGQMNTDGNKIFPKVKRPPNAITKQHGGG
jgi:hypothetical protein